MNSTHAIRRNQSYQDFLVDAFVMLPFISIVRDSLRHEVDVDEIGNQLAVYTWVGLSVIEIYAARISEILVEYYLPTLDLWDIFIVRKGTGDTRFVHDLTLCFADVDRYWWSYQRFSTKHLGSALHTSMASAIDYDWWKGTAYLLLVSITRTKTNRLALLHRCFGIFLSRYSTKWNRAPRRFACLPGSPM